MADQLEGAPNMRGGKRWLIAIKFIWVGVTVLTVLLLATSVPLRVDHIAKTVDTRSLLSLDLSTNTYAAYIIILEFTVTLVHILIAGLIFWRRADDWVALLVSFALVTNGAVHPLSALIGSPGTPSLWLWLANLAIFIALLSGFTLLYVFPDGRFVPAWTRILAVLWFFAALLAIFVPQSGLSFIQWPLWLSVLLLIIWSGVGVAAQIYRFEKASTPVQRQQTKWALLGLIAAALGPLVILFGLSTTTVNNVAPNILYQRVGSGLFTFSFLFQLLGLTIFRLGTLLFPLSFAIAVLRYRLWDIDIIIRRTITYAVFTALLVFLYMIIVVSLQLALGSMIPEASPLAVVVTTLIIAALFNPLRQRVQDAIDRRFYRHKYDAVKTLEKFGQTARDEVDLEKLSDELLQVVGDTVQPDHVSLWLIGD
jgi:hypothetical protein